MLCRKCGLLVLIVTAFLLLDECDGRRRATGRYKPPAPDYFAAVKNRLAKLTYHQQKTQKDVIRELLSGGSRGSTFRDQLKDILNLGEQQLEEIAGKSLRISEVVTPYVPDIPLWVKGFVVFFAFCGLILAASVYVYAMKPGEELTPRAPKRDQDAFKGLLYLLATAVAGFSIAILGALAGMLGFLWTGGTFIILAALEVLHLGILEGNRYVRLVKIKQSVPIFNLVMIGSLVVCFSVLGYGF